MVCSGRKEEGMHKRPEICMVGQVLRSQQQEVSETRTSPSHYSSTAAAAQQPYIKGRKKVGDAPTPLFVARGYTRFSHIPMVRCGFVKLHLSTMYDLSLSLAICCVRCVLTRYSQRREWYIYHRSKIRTAVSYTSRYRYVLRSTPTNHSYM